MKHTQGEWQINDVLDNSESIEVLANINYHFYSICNVWRIDVGSKEAEANAKLIAAAPDLLEALYTCRAKLKSDISFTDEDLKKVEAAIKKATE